jgi:microcystin-dependent protein
MHPGQGPGLSLHVLGEMSGSSNVTLLPLEMPLHSHALMAQNFVASDNVPKTNNLSRGVTGLNAYAAPGGATAMMSFQAIAPTGGSQPHNNMMPFMTYYFNIALQGVFPPRS